MFYGKPGPDTVLVQVQESVCERTMVLTVGAFASLPMPGVAVRCPQSTRHVDYRVLRTKPVSLQAKGLSPAYLAHPACVHANAETLDRCAGPVLCESVSHSERWLLQARERAVLQFLPGRHVLQSFPYVYSLFRATHKNIDCKPPVLHALLTKVSPDDHSLTPVPSLLKGVFELALGRARAEQHVLSKAHPQGNKKPTEDQPEAWTENSVPFQNPGSRSCSPAVEKTIDHIGTGEKDEQTNDDTDQMEHAEDSFPFTEQPSKGGQDPRQEREQQEEIEADCCC
jgi:hypothetical protein